MPEAFPVPVLVVQHLSLGFIEGPTWGWYSAPNFALSSVAASVSVLELAAIAVRRRCFRLSRRIARRNPGEADFNRRR